MAGLFITFEGGEGAGKTTQINRLAETLTKEGHRVVTTREPGGTPEAEKIRDLLVQRDGGKWSPLSETLMFLAARSLHIERVIAPAIANGAIVICDRFVDSTIAYQGYGHGLDIKTIESLNDIILEDLKPDLTFILDVDVKEGLARSGRRLIAEALQIKQKEDRFEQMALEFHERLRQGFLDIAKNNPQRCKLINAALTTDDVAQEILTQTRERL